MNKKLWVAAPEERYRHSRHIVREVADMDVSRYPVKPHSDLSHKHFELYHHDSVVINFEARIKELESELRLARGEIARLMGMD